MCATLTTAGIRSSYGNSQGVGSCNTLTVRSAAPLALISSAPTWLTCPSRELRRPERRLVLRAEPSTSAPDDVRARAPRTAEASMPSAGPIAHRQGDFVARFSAATEASRRVGVRRSGTPARRRRSRTRRRRPVGPSSSASLINGSDAVTLMYSASGAAALDHALQRMADDVRRRRRDRSSTACRAGVRRDDEHGHGWQEHRRRQVRPVEVDQGGHAVRPSASRLSAHDRVDAAGSLCGRRRTRTRVPAARMPDTASSAWSVKFEHVAGVAPPDWGAAPRSAEERHGRRSRRSAGAGTADPPPPSRTRWSHGARVTHRGLHALA